MLVNLNWGKNTQGYATSTNTAIASTLIMGMLLAVGSPTASAETVPVNLGFAAVGVGTNGGGGGTFSAECDVILATSCSGAAAIGFSGCQTIKAEFVINYLPDGDVEAEVCITTAIATAVGVVLHLAPVTFDESGNVVASDISGFDSDGNGDGTYTAVNQCCVLGDALALPGASKAAGFSRATLKHEELIDEGSCWDAFWEAYPDEDELAELANDKRCETRWVTDHTDNRPFECHEDSFGHVKSCGSSAGVQDDIETCGEGTAEVTSAPTIGEPTDAAASGGSAGCGSKAIAAFTQALALNPDSEESDDDALIDLPRVRLADLTDEGRAMVLESYNQELLASIDDLMDAAMDSCGPEPGSTSGVDTCHGIAADLRQRMHQQVQAFA